MVTTPPQPTTHPATIEVRRGTIHLDEAQVLTHDGVVALTDLEVAVLAYLLQNDGEPASRDALLRDVWGYSRTVRSRAVDHTIKRLRTKIECDRSKPEHLMTVPGVGYRLIAQPRVPRASHSPGGTFLGRQRELADLHALLHPGALITLHGPGGMGKSALAAAASRRHADRFTGGRHEVTFEPVDDAARAISKIARVVGLRSRDEVGTVTELGAWLGRREGCLFVLHSAEHVPELAAWIEQWHTTAPCAAFLVTSRVRLRATGEQLMEVGPLDIEDACALMWMRAREARRSLPDDESTRSALRTLATQLDGMPLAIELAAARSNLLAPNQLLDHLCERLALLSGPGQSLHGALDASWALCTAHEREALRQLTVFAGGFASPEVRDVVVLPGSPSSMLDLLQALRDQSWLTARPTVAGGLRLGMYDGVRDFILAQGPPDEPVQLRHAAAFARHGVAAELWRSRSTPDGLQRYEAEHDNHLRALETAIACGRADLAVPLWRACHKWLHYRGPFDRSVKLARRVVRMSLTQQQDAEVRMIAADMLRRIGDAEGCEAWARRAVDAARATADPELLGQARHHLGAALNALGRHDEAHAELVAAASALIDADLPVRATVAAELAAVHRHGGETARAQQLYRRALAMALQAGDLYLPHAVRNALASIARTLGDVDEAIAQYEAVISHAESLGWPTGYPRMNLGNLHADLGSYLQAGEQYALAHAEALETGNSSLEASVATNWGTVYAERGELDRADTLLRRALELHRQSGFTRMESVAMQALGDVALRRGTPERAHHHYEQAHGLAASRGLSAISASAELGLARCAHALGRLATATRWVAGAEEAFRAMAHPTRLAMARCIRGLIHVAEGHYEAASLALAEATELAPAAAGHPTSEVGALAGELVRALGARPGVSNHAVGACRCRA